MVGPKVAAASAQRALEVLAEEDPAVAAEAAALQQDVAQNGQGSADRSAAPGLHTQHSSIYICHSSRVERHQMLHAVVVDWSYFMSISVITPEWEPEVPMRARCAQQKQATQALWSAMHLIVTQMLPWCCSNR